MGKSGRAIFGTQTVGSPTSPHPNTPLKHSPAPTPHPPTPPDPPRAPTGDERCVHQTSCRRNAALVHLCVCRNALFCFRFCPLHVCNPPPPPTHTLVCSPHTDTRTCRLCVYTAPSGVCHCVHSPHISMWALHPPPPPHACAPLPQLVYDTPPPAAAVGLLCLKLNNN